MNMIQNVAYILFPGFDENILLSDICTFDKFAKFCENICWIEGFIKTLSFRIKFV